MPPGRASSAGIHLPGRAQAWDLSMEGQGQSVLSLALIFFQFCSTDFRRVTPDVHDCKWDEKSDLECTNDLTQLDYSELQGVASLPV